jgi:hypothetical protein
LKFFGLHKNLTGQLPAQIKKWGAKFFICWKGPLNTFKIIFFGFLKLGADDFFGRFLIFSFGL